MNKKLNAAGNENRELSLQELGAASGGEFWDDVVDIIKSVFISSKPNPEGPKAGVV